MKKINPFEELAKMFMEDFKKYGVIDEDGIIYFDDGVVKGRVGKIK